MRYGFQLAVIVLLTATITLGWCGIVTMNSGDPEYTEKFFGVAAVLFALAFLGLLGAHMSPEEEEE